MIYLAINNDLIVKKKITYILHFKIVFFLFYISYRALQKEIKQSKNGHDQLHNM